MDKKQYECDMTVPPCWRKLLELEDISGCSSDCSGDPSDEDAYRDDAREISFTFDDDNSLLALQLMSGGTNYYFLIQLLAANGNLIVESEPGHEINDVEELENDNVHVKINITFANLPDPEGQ